MRRATQPAAGHAHVLMSRQGLPQRIGGRDAHAGLEQRPAAPAEGPSLPHAAWAPAEGMLLAQLPGSVVACEAAEPLLAGAVRDSPSSGSKAAAPLTSTSLTCIPEAKLHISNFFRVVLAGSGSSDLTEVVCGSQLSEDYRPRGRRRSCRKDKGDVSPASPQSTRRWSVTSSSSSWSSASSAGGLCFFCPLGATRDRLACLKFEVVEGFSSSLPTIKSEAEARDACVVLMHWPAAGVVEAEDAHDARPTTGRATAEDSSLQDLRRRVAELNFQMKCAPMVFLLCVENSEEEALRAREVASSCRLNNGRYITLLCGKDSSVAGLGSTLKGIADAMLQELEGSPRTSLSRHDGARAPCCTLM